MVQIGTEKSQGYDYGRSYISLLIYEWGVWPSPPSCTTTHSLSVSVRGWRRVMPEVAAPPAEAASFRRPLYLFQLLLLMAGADALCLITPSIYSPLYSQCFLVAYAIPSGFMLVNKETLSQRLLPISQSCGGGGGILDSTECSRELVELKTTEDVSSSTNVD